MYRVVARGRHRYGRVYASDGHSMKARAMALALVLASLAAATAHAQDRRTESLARDAMKKAQLDALTHSWDSAIARLTKAATACTPIRCSNVIRASLSRDRGAM